MICDCVLGNTAAVLEMLRRYVERLSPYQSLALLAIPTSLVEPLKIFAVAIAGAGHWVAGTITAVCAYAVSLVLVERLFEIVKPKLLTLPWFARLWNWFVARRDRVLGWLCQAPTFGHSFALDDPLGCRVHPNLDFSPIRHPPLARLDIIEWNDADTYAGNTKSTRKVLARAP